MAWADLGREFALKGGLFEVVSNGGEKSKGFVLVRDNRLRLKWSLRRTKGRSTTLRIF